jgi:hypothetical protein
MNKENVQLNFILAGIVAVAYYYYTLTKRLVLGVEIIADNNS